MLKRDGTRDSDSEFACALTIKFHGLGGIMITRASQVSASFFNKANPTPSFPSSYSLVWKTAGSYSSIRRVKALLADYTKENFFLGSFFGRLFFGHWGRHHVDKVHEIIHTPYESVDDLIYDLKILKPQLGGSLDRRICFIDAQLTQVREARMGFAFQM